MEEKNAIYEIITELRKAGKSKNENDRTLMLLAANMMEIMIRHILDKEQT